MERREELSKFEEPKASLRRGDPRILVGIDIAKDAHVARIEYSDGRVLVEKMGIGNSRPGFDSFRERIEGLRRQMDLEVVLAFEPSGGYRKLLGDFLIQSGFIVVQVFPHGPAGPFPDGRKLVFKNLDFVFQAKIFPIKPFPANF